jgi:hypothetical protein
MGDPDAFLASHSTKSPFGAYAMAAIRAGPPPTTTILRGVAAGIVMQVICVVTHSRLASTNPLTGKADRHE